MFNKLLYFAVLGIIVTLASADVNTCMFKDKSGKIYNFASLISPSGSYMFKQQVWSIGGYSLDTMVSDTQFNVTFYLQVCRNIASPPSGCTDPGAVYSVTSDGKCTSWGDATVATFDLNPYQDGVNLKMYHGSSIDHLSNNAATIYFVCNQANNGQVRDNTFMFEHVKAAINQAHFKIFTDLAC